jgi:hypothetical protein
MPKHGWLDLDQMKAIGVQAADQAQSEAGDFAENPPQVGFLYELKRLLLIPAINGEREGRRMRSSMTQGREAGRSYPRA